MSKSLVSATRESSVIHWICQYPDPVSSFKFLNFFCVYIPSHIL
jgi:hypothetical protein